MFKDKELHSKVDELREILIRLVHDVQQLKTSQRADKKRDLTISSGTS